MQRADLKTDSSADSRAADAAHPTLAISAAIVSALSDLDSAVEWFVYGQRSTALAPSEVRALLLNVVARPGLVGSESLSTAGLRSYRLIDDLVDPAATDGIAE